MFSTSKPTALFPHEMDEVERMFRDILQECRLAPDCEAAEAIARRIFGYYQGGVREFSALKAMLGLEADPGSETSADRAFGGHEGDRNESGMKVPRSLEMADSPDAHGVWFGAKVLQALEDTRPDLEHVDVEPGSASEAWLPTSQD
ncbi:hypothetical protein LAC81_36925 (plasmid) [Ensifer adhaerens]|uniref:hypothetical protein n=1 Tax=Ensifer adhaerens TaxID=106592 RepID=UPI001CBEDF28|nr:hypothetical protein [Ensifer adhaerens]MBZ7927524.1 hypothetical protein [Ensifer adhaerens]UAX97943.1 hypothetical protein LAC78_38230 [Ensifer adhaerens]UAY05322.1 hypothetical protein LAC80_36940 [Ensifer adhaerens]UAY12700.1 hypothetical protein LAC81_36925 [Ensifer adhaerens]